MRSPYSFLAITCLELALTPIKLYISPFFFSLTLIYISLLFLSYISFAHITLLFLLGVSSNSKNLYIYISLLFISCVSFAHITLLFALRVSSNFKQDKMRSPFRFPCPRMLRVSSNSNKLIYISLLLLSYISFAHITLLFLLRVSSNSNKLIYISLLFLSYTYIYLPSFSLLHLFRTHNFTFSTWS